MYVNSKIKQKIQIPVIEAEIKAVTEDYKNLNKYTYYLLNLLFEAKDTEYIADITQFNKWQIENELKNLLKYGLAIMEGNSFVISDLGREVIRRSKEINNFNERNEKVLIDKLTGAVLNYNADYEVIENRKYTVIKDIYKNVNPSNSKEYFIKNFGNSFEDINVEDIDIELNLKKEYWIEIDIENFKCLIEKDEADGRLRKSDLNHYSCDAEKDTQVLDNLLVKGNIYKINVNYENKNLNSYRSSITSLKEINEFDNSLLSDKGRTIIKLYEEEERLNSYSKPLYFDSISGFFNTTGEFSSDKVKRNSMTIKLDERIKFEDLNEDNIRKMTSFLNEEIEEILNGNEYNIIFELEKEFEIIKEVDYREIYKGAGLC